MKTLMGARKASSRARPGHAAGRRPAERARAKAGRTYIREDDALSAGGRGAVARGMGSGRRSLGQRRGRGILQGETALDAVPGAVITGPLLVALEAPGASAAALKRVVRCWRRRRWEKMDGQQHQPLRAAACTAHIRFGSSCALLETVNALREGQKAP